MNQLDYNIDASVNMGPIGIFDSGYGGLTITSEVIKQLPQYDFIYLGDNSRSPYGSRSYEVVYTYTLQAVERLFRMGCQLIILACNTASAKALRTIQQQDLPRMGLPGRRVLGIIRPTVEALDSFTVTKHVGILGTEGTISSKSYPLEIAKLFPDITVTQESCPLWVPIVETGESNSPGADFFVRKHLDHILAQDDQIDTLVLACTHYPLLLPKIMRLVTPTMKIVSQGELVATSLVDYLERHPEMKKRLTQGRSVRYFTTENAEKFTATASIFLETEIEAQHISLES